MGDEKENQSSVTQTYKGEAFAVVTTHADWKPPLYRVRSDQGQLLVSLRPEFKATWFDIVDDSPPQELVTKLLTDRVCETRKER